VYNGNIEKYKYIMRLSVKWL